jgi:hypothetical protein
MQVKSFSAFWRKMDVIKAEGEICREGSFQHGYLRKWEEMTVRYKEMK